VGKSYEELTRTASGKIFNLEATNVESRDTWTHHLM
jgi:hypothetical protein